MSIQPWWCKMYWPSIILVKNAVQNSDGEKTMMLVCSSIFCNLFSSTGIHPSLAGATMKIKPDSNILYTNQLTYLNRGNSFRDLHYHHFHSPSHSFSIQLNMLSLVQCLVRKNLHRSLLALVSCHLQFFFQCGSCITQPLRVYKLNLGQWRVCRLFVECFRGKKRISRIQLTNWITMY